MFAGFFGVSDALAEVGLDEGPLAFVLGIVGLVEMTGGLGEGPAGGSLLT